MSTLTIRHLTTYRYRQPVAFGEHRMMLRPRDSAEQRVTSSRLLIDPEPVSLDFIQDSFGNHIGIARFSGRARALRVESQVSVEHSPPAFSGTATDAFPPLYPQGDRAALAGFLGDDVDSQVADWARRFLPATGSWSLLCSLSDGIHRDFRYRRREARGIQTPQETLGLGEGSCRDFAVLMIAAARVLGFAARFASGYLAVPLDRPSETPGASDVPDGSETGHGSTHAWAQVYLPLLGWIDFDPTNGTIGPQNLVTVAVVEQPEDATPLHGTFLGFPSDHIGMDVAVTITKHPIAA